MAMAMEMATARSFRPAVLLKIEHPPPGGWLN
jgi:hypothetical protein